jgi:hypothetical protein
MFISNALQFPPDWRIENASMKRDGVLSMEISGSDFPETSEGETPLECMVIVNERQRTFEVKIIGDGDARKQDRKTDI